MDFIGHLSFLRSLMPPLVWLSSNLKYKFCSGRRYKFWLWHYHLTLPSFNVVLHGDHRSLFVLCVTAQWPLGCSAMINSGRPQGRTARIGYPARDLVSIKTLALWQPQPQSPTWLELRLELATFHTCS